MKETYRMHAYHYITSLYNFVTNWFDTDNINDAVDKVFWHTGKQAKVEHGSARIAVIGSDFVIKWDYNEDSTKEIGGCEDEFRIYKWSLSTGFSHLLAPCYRIIYRKRYFYIMPFIHNIGLAEHGWKDVRDFCSKQEGDWLFNNIGDLHSWNWGIEDNKIVVIDYACPRKTVTSSSSCSISTFSWSSD